MACCGRLIIFLMHVRNSGLLSGGHAVGSQKCQAEDACLNSKCISDGSADRFCTEFRSVLRAAAQRCIWRVQGTGQCCTAGGTSGPGNYAHNWADGLVSDATVLAAGGPPTSWCSLVTGCLSEEGLPAKVLNCCHEAAS